MRIIMLSSTFPYPPSRGGTEIRTFNLLLYLAKYHHVTLVTQLDQRVSAADIEMLRSLVGELLIFPLGRKLPGGKVVRFLESVIKATPPNVLSRYCPEIAVWLCDQVNGKLCDVITCEHSVNEIYIRPWFKEQVKTIVNVHSSVYGWVKNHLDMGASLAPIRDRLYLNLVLSRYERRYCQKFSHIVVTTRDDQTELLQFAMDIPITIIPNGVDLSLFAYRTHDPGGYNLIYIGAMDASHNIDAVRFFALDVLPLLQLRYPETKFWIVGANPSPEVVELKSNSQVVVTGSVPSMVAYLHQATVCVVPLRTGLGIKNKTLEAMSAGVPVVASDRGLEGLAVDDPLCAIRANTVDEYVAGISRLFADPNLRLLLASRSRALIESEYTWDIAQKRYEEVICS